LKSFRDVERFQGVSMRASRRRATICLRLDIYRALRLKAAAAGKSVSDVVNEALRHSLAEDAEDLHDAAKRRTEKSSEFERIVKAPRRRRLGRSDRAAD